MLNSLFCINANKAEAQIKTRESNIDNKGEIKFARNKEYNENTLIKIAIKKLQEKFSLPSERDIEEKIEIQNKNTKFSQDNNLCK